MTTKDNIMEGVVERWDGNRVRPRVKTTRMGLQYRIRIDGRWFFFDTRGFRSAEVTGFFSTLEPGMAIKGQVRRQRGHDCLAWAVGEKANVAPLNVLRIGLWSAQSVILGLASLELLSLILSQPIRDSVFFASLFIFGELPIVAILFVIAIIGAIFGILGVITALDPRKRSTFASYRREMVRRASGVQL